MKVLLVQIRVAKALLGKKNHSADMSKVELAYNTIILHLGDRVLRKMLKETTTAGIWSKLE